MAEGRHQPPRSHTPLTGLDPAEYDFSKLPEEELWPCLFFELGREMPHTASLVKTWRKHEALLADFPFSKSLRVRTLFIKDLNLSREDTRDIFTLSIRGYRAALASLEFPRIPWQRLPPEVRQAALKNLNLTTEAIVRPKESRLPESKATKLGFPIGNWGKSDTQLLKELKAWLAKHRPVEEEPTRPGPVIGAKEMLQRLAAFRICRYAQKEFGSVDKIDLVDPEWGERDQRTLRQYRRDIERIIADQEGAWAGVVENWI